MRILLLGNMNNMFFSMTRYLRDLGYCADVYCMPNSHEHFRPEADDYRNISDLDYVRYLDIEPTYYTFSNYLAKKISKLCESYSIIIAQGMVMAFLEKANITVDIAIPYGSDLYQIPFEKFKPSFNPKKLIKSFLMSRISSYQARSFQRARVVVVDKGYSLYGDAVSKLNIKAIYPGLACLYVPPKEVSRKLPDAYESLKEHDFLLFNHSRQYWITNQDNLQDFNEHIGVKRNDRVIKAFSNFMKVTKYKNPALVLFEYGPDVKQSKSLIEELNIKENVLWFRKISRKEIMQLLPLSSLTTTTFRENIAGSGGVGIESLAAGTANINNMEGIKGTNNILSKSPMIHALTEEDIYEILLDYERNPKKYKDIAKSSKEWFNRNMGSCLADKYGKLCKYLCKNKSATLENSRAEIQAIFQDGSE